MKQMIVHVDANFPDEEFQEYMDEMKEMGMTLKDFVETFTQLYTSGVDDVIVTITFDQESYSYKKQ